MLIFSFSTLGSKIQFHLKQVSKDLPLRNSVKEGRIVNIKTFSEVPLGSLVSITNLKY